MKQYKTSEQERLRANQYYQTHRDKCLKQRKAYYNIHRDEIREYEKSLRASPEYGITKREYDRQKYQKNATQKKIQSNIYYHKNKDKRKNYLLKIKYGLSLKEYKNKLDEQNGKCEICNRQSSKSLVVDHDHTTNQIRGLLCNSCNRALGLFQDDNTLIQKASKYLTKWSTTYAASKRP